MEGKPYFPFNTQTLSGTHQLFPKEDLSRLPDFYAFSKTLIRQRRSNNKNRYLFQHKFDDSLLSSARDSTFVVSLWVRSVVPLLISTAYIISPKGASSAVAIEAKKSYRTKITVRAKCTSFHFQAASFELSYNFNH